MGKFKQIDIELKSLEEETNQTIYQHTLKTVDSILDIVNTKDKVSNPTQFSILEGATEDDLMKNLDARQEKCYERTRSWFHGAGFLKEKK